MNMLPVDMQKSNEYMYARKHVLRYVRTFIEKNEEITARVEHGVTLVEDWLSKSYFPSKDKRLAEIKLMDIKQLVTDIFCSTAMFQREETFVSAASQIAKHLSFDDRRDSIHTVGELLGVLCYTGVFVIWKESKESQMLLRSQMRLPNTLINAVHRSQYLPPMVCVPETVKTNFESGHLTVNDTQILGKHSSHCDDICLDILNIQNQIPLKLCTEFISTVEEEPNPGSPLDSVEKQINWDRQKCESYEIYLLLAKQGNKFYQLNSYDKRGRMYTSGYHVNFQGASFKRACIELHNEELIQGM
tara:strand:- start:1350 stop:2255 length:906 start_codon:yes stop_codon:yes gene_type:complete